MRAILAVLAAAVLVVGSACEPTYGQTGVVLDIRSETPVDCLEIVARKPGGEAVTRQLEAPEQARTAFRTFDFKALIYAGGALGDGAVSVTIAGHLADDAGRCLRDEVSAGAASFSFRRGETPEVQVLLRMKGADTDEDGFADTFDCGPTDARVFPRPGNETSAECDGLDNDCDGLVDEGCPCTAPRSCYPLGLTAAQAGVGACALGTQSCDNGKYGACTGAVLPAPEQCDGVDTDCDGVADPESCPCKDGDTRTCFDAGPASLAGKGACKAGVQTCAGGAFGPCVGAVGPSAEVCGNRLDDDCDELVDAADPDASAPACPKQDGVCALSRVVCGSTATACSAEIYRTGAERLGVRYAETEGPNDCDGIDNDCDGQVDENCPCTQGAKEACHPLGASHPRASQGACHRGVRSCLPSGTWGPCEGAAAPVDETCNGLDDDCDGQVDEGARELGAACTTSQPGTCRPGVTRCVRGVTVCESLSPAASDESCNGLDDDCDGVVDEGFDKANDPAHCGGPDSCRACATGNLCCNGTCADTQGDPLHCGGCGEACLAGNACCAGGCVDLANDEANCGRCGQACALGEACRAGTCAPAQEAACGDGADEDKDGLTDCADPDCGPEATCGTGPGGTVTRVCRAGLCFPKTEPRCDDGTDDDGDGLVDCQDPDCPAGATCGSQSGYRKVCRAGACALGVEVSCSDGLDDDGDGLVDCADADCPARTACDARGGVCFRGACSHETSCSNGTDDDGDARADCADADCGPGSVCDATGGTCLAGSCVHEQAGQCGNASDDDKDGLVDCADPDCPSGTACAGGGTCCVVQGQRACAKETLCGDGADNDCDGKIDCADPDCPGCGAGKACCNGACRDTTSDPRHCKGCGISCDDQKPCTADSCGATGCLHANVSNRATAPGCEGSNLCCNGQCVSGTESGAACTDGIDNDCDGLADCQDPDCPCAAGSACCGNSCVDVTASSANCGACGRACPAPAECRVAACSGGSCTTQAAPDRTRCTSVTNGVCCGGGCVSGTESGAACTNGQDDDCDGLADCQDPDCAAVTSGLTWCPLASACLRLADDEANCGACGVACRAGENCLAGRCLRETLSDVYPFPLLECADSLDNDGDGAVDCSDTDCSDGASCGSDGRVCCGGSCAIETCTNGVDDDCDGLADCADPDCAAKTCGDGLQCVSGACTCTPTSCGDGCCSGSGSTCRRYASQTNSSCGVGGAACAACVLPTPLCSRSSKGCDSAPPYIVNPAVYTRTIAITPNSPDRDLGAGVTYTISPALPTGLTINASTGVISGTATVLSTATTYTVSITTAAGTTTTTLSITVNDVPPSITYTPSTKVCTKGAACAFAAPANGIGPALSYAVAPALPAGMTLNPTTGAISGSPTVLVTTPTNYVVTGTNSGGTGTATLTITVNDVAPAISYAPATKTCTKGFACNVASPNSTGGAVVSYAISPTLPSGLAFDTLTGAISGAATVLSVTPVTYTITATNSGGTGTTTYALNVIDVPPSITYAPASQICTKGTTCSWASPASSGGAVVSYAISPPLPTGLSLNPGTGAITGNPSVLLTTATTYTITATNSGGTGTATVTLTVNDAPPNVTYAGSPKVCTRGVACSLGPPTSSGGTVVTYSVSPALPAGLALNATSGTISGTPSGLQTSPTSYAITASNSGGNQTVNVVLTINDQVAVPTYSSSSVACTKGVPCTIAAPSVANGVALSFSVSPALPAGLSLDAATGAISGTATTLQVATAYTVTATNSGGNGLGSIAIAVVDVVPSISYTPSGQVCVKGFTCTFTGPANTGGTVLSWSISPALPAGMSFSTSTGVITGNPAALQTLTNHTVTATNSGGSGSTILTLTVNDVAPAIAYAGSPKVCTKNAACTFAAPTVTGGAVVSYAVSPALPAGMTLNTATGAISGSPSVLVTTTTSYVVTATNSGGSGSATLLITVNDVVPTISYSPSTAACTKGQACNVSAPNNSGGAALTFAIAPSTLPAGISFNTATGALSGTASELWAAQAYSITATNSGGTSSATTLTFSIKDVIPSITYSPATKTCTRNSACTFAAPTVTGGAVVTWAISGTLPTGMTFNTGDGSISGTPTVIQTTATNYTVTATNSGGNGTTTITLTVNDIPPSITYAPSSVACTRNSACTFAAPTNAGGPATSFAIVGTLPSGMSLNTSTGAISGTPSVIQTSPTNYTINATNSGGTGSTTITLTVNDIAPNITYAPTTLTCTKGTACSLAAPTSSGGPVVSYAISPTLPAGLNLNTGTGAISGTPSVLQAATTFTVTATNSGGSNSKTLTITVNDVAPNIAYASNTLTCTKDAPCSLAAPTSSGGAVVSFAISPALPAGMALDPSTGAISGTPTVVLAATSFTVTATNSGGTNSKTGTLTVNDVAPSISYAPATLTCTKDVACSLAAPASSGGTVVSYGISPALPAGLNFNTSTGTITGTPTGILVATTFTVTATNSGGTNSQTLTITVNDSAPNVTYSPDASYATGATINLSPASTGGAVISYAFPGPSFGLSINASTGALTGTLPGAAGTYLVQVTATNSGGSVTVDVTFTVN